MDDAQNKIDAILNFIQQTKTAQFNALFINIIFYNAARQNVFIETEQYRKIFSEIQLIILVCAAEFTTILF